MEIWKEILIAAVTSLFSGGCIAWVFLRLFVKDVAGTVANEKIDEKLKIYTTREQMQLERRDLMDDVRREFLEKVAFEQFTKGLDEKFDFIGKTMQTVVENQEHIKEYIIRRGDFK